MPEKAQSRKSRAGGSTRVVTHTSGRDDEREKQIGRVLMSRRPRNAEQADYDEEDGGRRKMIAGLSGAAVAV